jgi:hypothetical protein
MKIIVAGSRYFKGKVYQDYDFVKTTLDEIFKENNIKVNEIVSGNALGIDRLGEKYANEYFIPLVVFKPKWYVLDEQLGLHVYDNNAGLKRNIEMAHYADILIAFNAGTTGTNHMIKTMKELSKTIYIVTLE